MAYVKEHETNLTELALKAGLSSGSLGSLVKYPERIPALETCLRLSKVTGKPSDEIFQMAGLQGWVDKFQAEVQAQKQTNTELRSSIDGKQTEIRILKSQMDKLEKELERVENQKEILENTISQQNKILAQQHEQLVRLLSSTQ